MTFALRLRHFDQTDVPDREALDWFAERYRDHLTKRVAGNDYSAQRLKGTMSYVDSFLRFVYEEEDSAPVRVGTLAPEHAGQSHLTAWMTSNYARWKKGSTRADALGAVLGCFNWLEDHGFLTSPFRRPRGLKFPRVHFRAMRKRHYRAVMREARKHPGSKAFRLIFFAAWHAGVRLIEFRRLEPHEVDLECLPDDALPDGSGSNGDEDEARVVRLPPGKHKTGKITGDVRIAGVGARLASVLRGLIQTMRPGQKYVFLSPRGKPWGKDNLGRQYARFRRLAGVPADVKMCALRHGYAFRLLARGDTSNKAVADQLGHKSTRMVDSIYGAETRYDAAMVRDVASKAERGKKKPASRERKRPERPTSPMPLFEGLE